MAERSSRREFVCTCAKAALAAAAASTLVPASALAQGKDQPAWIATLGKVKDLNEKQPTLVKAKFLDKDGRLMEEEKIYVRWQAKGKDSGCWIVLSAICTHLKCKIDYIMDEGIFRCPCHKSEYDLDGTVIHKPAKKNLADYSALAYEESGLLKLKREAD